MTSDWHPPEQRYWQNRETANIGLGSSVGREPARQSGGRRFKSRSSQIFFVHPKFIFSNLIDRAGFCQLYLHCSTEEAVARNSERCHGIPKETILKMAGKMEAPDQQTASWEKNVIQVNAEEVNNGKTM